MVGERGAVCHWAGAKFKKLRGLGNFPFSAFLMKGKGFWGVSPVSLRKGRGMWNFPGEAALLQAYDETVTDCLGTFQERPG
jgi:hypothetical protein